jgi:hypothetical protein
MKRAVLIVASIVVAVASCGDEVIATTAVADAVLIGSGTESGAWTPAGNSVVRGRLIVPPPFWH